MLIVVVVLLLIAKAATMVLHADPHVGVYYLALGQQEFVHHVLAVPHIGTALVVQHAQLMLIVVVVLLLIAKMATMVLHADPDVGVYYLVLGQQEFVHHVLAVRHIGIALVVQHVQPMLLLVVMVLLAVAKVATTVLHANPNVWG